MRKKNEITFSSAQKFAATFTQLFDNSTPFESTNSPFAQRFSQHKYLCELFTNVKIRQKQIPDYIKALQILSRKIINNDVRYRQRSGDLPAAVGVRAFGVTPLGAGWYSPNIKIGCSNAKVVEYICRQWCKRTNQYPKTLTAEFDGFANATNAMPANHKYKGYYQELNICVQRAGHIIEEEYYISQPFRMEHYLNCAGIQILSFGSACRVLETKDVCFDDLNGKNINATLRQFSAIIDDCFAVKGTRAIQPWGHNHHREDDTEKLLPTIKHKRNTYGANTDRKAALYYRACRAGYAKFNAYIYGRLKAHNV